MYSQALWQNVSVYNGPEMTISIKISKYLTLLNHLIFQNKAIKSIIDQRVMKMVNENKISPTEHLSFDLNWKKVASGNPEYVHMNIERIVGQIFVVFFSFFLIRY